APRLPAVCALEHAVVQARVERAVVFGINSNGVDNLRVRLGFDRGPAFTAIDAHEKAAASARVQSALDARVDGEREDLDLCAREASVDGAPAVPAVRALEQAVALRPSGDGGGPR